MVWIKARAGDKADLDNYIGVSTEARESFDHLDFFEPPPMGKFISLYFPHDEWSDGPRQLGGDFRPLADDGSTWDFVVKTNDTDSRVDLEVEGMASVRAEFEANLFDLDYRKEMDLRSDSLYTFRSGKGVTLRRFKLAVGSTGYIQEVRATLPALPSDYTLSQNYPNPFNPETTIRFELPEPGSVCLRIYNIRGQLVRTLVNEERGSGYHAVTWDGRDDRDRAVASGVYFYRLQVGKFSQSRRMVFLK